MFKKLCVVICILLLVCAVAPCVASADSSAHIDVLEIAPNYRIVTLVDDNGNPNGVGLADAFYFGDSGIQVVLNVYSSKDLPIDFHIGDGYYEETTVHTATTLTPAQSVVKHTVVDMFTQIHKMINTVDACANTQYNGMGGLPTSDVYRYNMATQGQTLQIYRETYEMLLLARQMYNDTDGAFNPAVYRLVDLWGFSSRIYSNGNFGLPYDREVTAEHFFTKGYPLPDDKYTEAFSAPSFLDFSQTAVTLNFDGTNYTVTKNVAPAVVDGQSFDQWLDLGGIAKGYVVDCAKQILLANGATSYYIDAGTSSQAIGESPDGTKPQLYITDPVDFKNNLTGGLFAFEVDPCSISSSGQYVRKYTTNGVEYAHIIDGAMGKPAQTGVVLVSVVVPQSEGLWAGKGDCLTTALTVMGRDKLVQFANGYLKQHNITVVVIFQTVDGKYEILTNLRKDQITYSADSIDDFAWALNCDADGNYFYDSTQTFGKTTNPFKVLMIVLASLIGVVLVALLVYHFVHGKKHVLQNVQHARHDKPFKPADIGVYLLVVFAIVVLFAVFFAQKDGWNTVEVVDIQTGEQLFLYNFARDEYVVNVDNTNGWQVSVTPQKDGLLVTFTKQVGDETRFNTVKITRGANQGVKMEDSRCGFHQDCVHNFGELNYGGGVIVCSPNRLKVITGN